MWQDSQVLDGVPVTWELFKTTFLERFFPRDMRESMVDEFINIKQESMTVREYSLKFVKLSWHSTSLVSRKRDEMSRFLTGINRDLEEECQSAMLHDNMDLSRLRRSAASRGGRPELRKGNGDEMQRPIKDFAKCGCSHSGECRQGTNACFGCGKSRQMVKDCPRKKGQVVSNAQPRPNPKDAAASEPPKRNRFYGLKGMEEQEKVYTFLCNFFAFSHF
nr:uncharacterized protein LOC104647104 [Solanum lycopersicum]